MTEILTEPLPGPAAWRGSELASCDDWSGRLTPVYASPAGRPLPPEFAAPPELHWSWAARHAGGAARL